MNQTVRQTGLTVVTRGDQYLPRGEKTAAILESGACDVYAVIGGRRIFLHQIEACALVVAPAPTLGQIALVARQEAVLRRTLVEAVRPQDWIDAIKAWCAALSTGLARLAHQRPALAPMHPGNAVTVEPGLSITAAHGMVWVATAGLAGLSFLDIRPLAARGFLPVTHRTWISLDADQSVTPITTQDVLTHAPVGGFAWLDLPQAFTSLALDTVARFIDREEAAAAETIAQREDKVAADLSLGVERFQRILTDNVSLPQQASDCGFVWQMIARDKPDQQVLKRDIADFDRFCDLQNARTRGITLRPDWWRQDTGPMVLTLRDSGRLGLVRTDALGRYRLHLRGARTRRITAHVAATLAPEARIVSLPLANRPLKVRDIMVTAFAMCTIDLSTLVVGRVGSRLLHW